MRDAPFDELTKDEQAVEVADLVYDADMRIGMDDAIRILRAGWSKSAPPLLEQARAECDRLRHLLGSHADGHRCSCTMIDGGMPGLRPAEWEQDPWCLTHPDMNTITAEVENLRTAVELYAEQKAEARSALEHVKDRMDDHAYDELACPLEDGALDEYGVEYRSRLDAARAVLNWWEEQGHGLNPQHVPDEGCLGCRVVIQLQPALAGALQARRLHPESGQGSVPASTPILPGGGDEP